MTQTMNLNVPVTAPGRRALFVRLAARWWMVAVLAIVLVGASALYPRFWAPANLLNLLAQNAPLGIMAVGMTFAMIAGGFDLSVGAVYSAGAVSLASFGQHLPVAAALPVTLLIGAALGALNGAVVTRLQVNPFIATLGSGFVYGGLAFILTGSTPVIVHDPAFQVLGQGAVAGVPISIIVAAVVFAVGGVVLARTVYGQTVYAVGGNAEAARLAGIRVRTVQASTYILVGVLAALAGAMLASRIGVGQADVGSDITLQVIAVVVIGGTSLFGGEGSIARTLVGLLILSVIQNVADSLGWDSNVENVTTGVIVVVAVAVDAAIRRTISTR